MRRWLGALRIEPIARPRMPMTRHPALSRFLLIVLWAVLAACSGGESAPPVDPKDSPGADLSQGDAAAGCESADACGFGLTQCNVPVCEAGQCASAPAPDGSECDDGDACTKDDACAAGKCVAGASVCACKVDTDCAPKEDGNPCTGTLYCDAKTNNCVVNPATVIDCPDVKAPCLAVACDPLDGKCRPLPADEGEACDDGQTCTQGEACAGGSCVGLSTCTCSEDADCAEFEDGNACNGTLYCDVDVGACKLNPASVVKCSPYADGPCATTACDTKTGLCGKQAVADGNDCDIDGLACTVDLCQGGVCQPGAASASCGCLTQADCQALDDDNACNGQLYCNLAAQKCELDPNTVVHCPTVDDGPCQSAKCMPKTGKCVLVALADKTPCDDGNPCSGESACAKGECEGSAPLCACKVDEDCAAFPLADACKGALYCNKAAGWCALNPATATICSGEGDTTCLHNLCDPQDGTCKAMAVADGVPCEFDGTWCTGVDTCKGGKCGAGLNKCACQADKDCAAFEDGNACNGSLFCDKASGKCQVNPASVVVCPPGGDGCSPSLCDSQSGKCTLKAVTDGTPCDTDLSPCTVERCQSGKCAVTVNKCLCPKGDLCDAWEDGNPCNGTLFCNKEVDPPACQVNPSTIVKCKPGDPAACVAPKCDPADGVCKVVPVKQGLACLDDDICTVAETCVDGACSQLPGAATLDCDDGNPCTGDACKKDVGCAYTADDSGAACDDGSGCTVAETCQKGACVAVAKLEGVLFVKQGLVGGKHPTVVVVDADGKGGKDLIALSGDDEDANKQSAWLSLGDGKGGFTEAKAIWAEQQCTNNPGAKAVSQADLDGDGLPELLLTRGYDKGKCGAASAPTAWAWIGKISHGASASMSVAAMASYDPVVEKVSLYEPIGMVAADLFKGGEVEVAIFGALVDTAGVPSNNLIILNKTAGSWKLSQKLSLKPGPDPQGAGLNIQAVDLDGDDDLDLLVGPDLPDEWTLTTRAYINQAGTFAESDLGIVGKVVWVDFDQDGAGDLVWQPLLADGKTKAGQAVVWRRNDGKAGWFAKAAAQVILPADGTAFLLLAAGQFDGPGPVDLALGGDETLSLLRDVATAGAAKKPVVLGLWGLETPTLVTRPFANGIETITLATNGMFAWYEINAGPCVDDNGCTSDSCVADQCVHLANAAFCSDDNECTEGDGCVAGACKGQGAKGCDDGTPCTADTCDPVEGCANKPDDGAKCNDDNGCTDNDVCKGGSCQGNAINCDDGDSCTLDACNGACVHQALSSGACDDGNPCTDSDGCDAGACSGAPVEEGEPGGCPGGDKCFGGVCK